jgi:arylsulfatase A-like enzyme
MHRATRLAALTLAFLTASCGAPERTPRPSIVLVSIDSLRADHVGCYGYPKPTTPAIDAVAAGGVRFASAVSTTSWTLPAHAAMFTGLYDSTHGLISNGLALSESLKTLAEVLRDAGYQTAGFYGGPYLHPDFGLAQGFETYESCMMPPLAALDGPQIRAASQQPSQPAHADVTSPRTVEKVEAWSRKADPRPFFAFVHLWDVHYDYIPPPEYVDMFDPDYQGHLDARGYMLNKAIRPGMDPRDFQHLLALYDGEIRFTDDHLSRILALLAQEAGGADELLVVITADHGDEFFDHGGKGHQRTLYDEVIRVPLVVRWPGHIAPGKVIDEQVRLIDLMPTLCAAASVDLPGGVQGRNLLPLLAAHGPLHGEPALSELHVPPYELRALRSDGFKLISRHHGTQLDAYDLAQDPRETTRLPETDPRIARDRTKLSELVERSVGLREKLEADPRMVVTSPDLQQMLKALGYTGDK